MSNKEKFRDKIINGDSVDVMKYMPDSFVDLVITEPPRIPPYEFTIKYSKSKRMYDWLFPAFSEIYRVMNPNSFCISRVYNSSLENVIKVSKRAGLSMVEEIVFPKTQPTDDGYLYSQHESALVLIKGSPTPEKPGQSKDLIIWDNAENTLGRDEMPVSVIKPLISAFSKPGSVVLDPFAGKGNVGIAAKEMRRNFICIESFREYCLIARRRLATIDKMKKLSSLADVSHRREHPKIRLSDGKSYFIDNRLNQIRNVTNPHEFKSMDELGLEDTEKIFIQMFRERDKAWRKLELEKLRFGKDVDKENDLEL